MKAGLAGKPQRMRLDVDLQGQLFAKPADRHADLAARLQFIFEILPPRIRRKKEVTVEPRKIAVDAILRLNRLCPIDGGSKTLVQQPRNFFSTRLAKLEIKIIQR